MEIEIGAKIGQRCLRKLAGSFRKARMRETCCTSSQAVWEIAVPSKL